MSKSSSGNDSESTALGWKFIIIVAGITTIFFTFLYLAMSSEPDYMPNQDAKKGHYQLKATPQQAPETQQDHEAMLQHSEHADQDSQHQAKP
ncbi:hypothetical protein IAE19_12885 [Acinetobacter sp. S40]|uniref:hypothetical protein n=1 Tax=Acinetobacter sp. S40 TaxID=2767434 RepID=UPI001909D99A|nr:hypothetical protein [Acinetobacter sp. S40]MBJ9986328.1 hypothetical protein [Acinetobacter sp. S40]